MAAGNVDCPLTEISTDLSKVFLYSYPNIVPVSNLESQAYLDMQPEANANDSIVNQETQQHQLVMVNDNDKNENIAEETADEFPHSRTLFDVLCLNDNDIIDWDKRSSQKSCYQPRLLPSIIPEEQQLHINIETDTESMHSWRPNLTNSLSSDFFLTKPAVDNSIFAGHGLLSQITPDNSREVSQKADEAVSADDNSQGLGTDSNPFVLNFCPESSRSSQVNIERYNVDHVQSQKAQFNALKYEVINAERRIQETKELIAQLNYKLKEKQIFKNSQDIEKLTDENAQLQVECQCLCMEVDFYLKGDAPLGEIDESFYRGNGTQDSGTDCINEVKLHPKESLREQQNTAVDQEEAGEWDCTKCTFANHPAISSCEMCHMPRFGRENPMLVSSSPDTCYCHPRVESS